jgi:uncharacterized protein YjbI with pentapeptide repeats
VPDGGQQAASDSDAGHGAPSDTGHGALRADCERCFGLCCTAPAFAASADFAIDKQAGQACPNLQADFRCAIHDRLRPRGFRGCAVYDCFGAGQKVAQVTFGGQDWRQTPEVAAPMFDTFMIMRQLHELLWYLNEALALQQASPIHADLRIAFDQTERLTDGSPGALAELDVNAHRGAINTLLRWASDLARAGYAGGDFAGADLTGKDLRGTDLIGKDLHGTDLIGKDLHGTNLSGASLRGAYLIGASLKDADLTAADLTGADLRGADLSGANLAGSIFLTQSQLDSASGDYRTKVSAARTRPAHWAGPAAGPTNR